MKWISIKDRLPDNKQMCICYNDCPHVNYRVLVLQYQNGGIEVYPDKWVELNIQNETSGHDNSWYVSITHWMPLPKGVNPEQQIN